MNTQDACNLLGIRIGASDDEVSKAFKNKALETHPDKKGGSEDAFKRVNEAKQYLDKNGTAAEAPQGRRGHWGRPQWDERRSQSDMDDELRRRMNDLFQRREILVIQINTSVPVEDYIKGSTVKINFTRENKCKPCEGSGKTDTNKVDCPKCKGIGFRFYGNDTKSLPCKECKAKGFTSDKVPCQTCKGKKVSKEKRSLDVKIPPGASKVSLKGEGNWMNGHQYNSVRVNVSPTDSDNMLLNGDDVISHIELTFLEALEGVKKDLHTVKGSRTLVFKPKTRNKDRISVKGFGVPPNGSHIFIVNVEYPDDVSDIIEVLKKNTEEPSDDEDSDSGEDK